MATLAQLETALRNADKAGDMDAARKLAAVIGRARADAANQIPETQVPETVQTPPEPSMGEEIIGAGETALTLGTGAVGGSVGMIGGALKGLAEQILSGQFGTPQAAKLVEQSAAQGGQALTYTPRTQAGQENVQAIGEVLQNVPPVIPVIGPIGAVAQSTKAAMPIVSATARRAAAPVVQAVQKAAEPLREILPTQAAQAGRFKSAGAAATPESVQRRTVAESLPVPFEGESALTKGQASRDFGQLQFEKESAKLGDVGAPLRKRVLNQTETLLANFDAMVDQAGPIRLERRAIGQAVDQAVVNKYNVMQKRVRDAYTKAREAGEMEAPVELKGLPEAFRAVEDVASTSADASQLLNGIKSRAAKYGNVSIDESGAMSPALITLNDAEGLRQFINSSTEWSNPRQSLIAKRLISSIDDAMEGQGGELFKAARNTRRQLANEFENVGLTAKLLGTKGKTNERAIAFEDVFDKVIIASPVEEMNKLRRTLLQAGPDGKQAWADLKAKGIDHIKENALSASQLDEAGRPLLSPDKLRRMINQMDEAGKLDSLYGKKQAQTIRDLGEIASVIYTAPPGAVNQSGTASALRVALDSAATFGLSGLPVPAVTALKEAAKYVRNRETRARIQDALKPSK